MLRHLAHLQLLEDEYSDDAVLAADGLFLKPMPQTESGNIMSPDQPSKLSSIHIPSLPVQRYLLSEDGREEKTLIELGVSSRIVSEFSKTTSGEKQTKRPSFVPQGSPLAVLEALQTISSNSSINQEVQYFKRRSLEGQFGRNAIRDLSTLGLIQSDGEFVILVSSLMSVDPESVLKHRAANSASMKVARSLLLTDPYASTAAIAAAVALETGNVWSNAGTLKRHGGALRRWALWLEPHLIDPSEYPSANALVVGARDGEAKKGSRRKISGALEDLVIQRLNEGKTLKSIAEEISVSATTLQSWKKRTNR